MSLLVGEACCVLTWDVNVGGHTIPSSPGTILVLRLCRVVNPNEWNWYCNIWKVWPILQDHCEHWKQSLAWLVFFFFLSCDWLFCNQLRRNRLNWTTPSWLLIPITYLPFLPLICKKKCSHVKQLIDADCRDEMWLVSVDVPYCFWSTWNPFEKCCGNTLQSIEAQMKCDTTDLALLQ